MLNKIKGAIFDMDGTLIDSLIVWQDVWDGLAERFNGGKSLNITENDDKAVRTMLLSDAMDFIHSKYNIGRDGSELLKATEEIVEKFYSEKVELKGGVKEFLEHLSKKGISMCIASATDLSLLNLAIDRCGIREYFKGVLSCSQVGKGKDEPDVFLKAAEFLGTSIEETAVFEDSYVAIRTAAKAGFKTVGIYDKFNFDFDKIEELSDVAVREGETLQKLLD